MTEKQEKHKARRKELRELSKIAKMRMSADCEGMTVNEILIQEFYTDNTNKEFKTLMQWSKDGFKVNKGSQSFLVWGKPKQSTKSEENTKNKQEEEEENEFYPICYLFSNAQVTKR